MSKIPRAIPGWRPSTPAVTDAMVKETLQSHPAVAIHFWAKWNGADPLLDRSIQDIQKQYRGRMHFVCCDVDAAESIELCRSCNVVNIPFLAVFVGNEQRPGIMGVWSADALAKELDSRLAGPLPSPKWWQFWQTA